MSKAKKNEPLRLSPSDPLSRVLSLLNGLYAELLLSGNAEKAEVVFCLIAHYHEARSFSQEELEELVLAVAKEVGKGENADVVEAVLTLLGNLSEE